jgi:hypothetical protein
MEYCNRNDIKPDWPFMHSLVEYYKISLTAPMLLPAVSVRDKKSPPQKKQGTNPRSRDKTSHVPPVDATTEEFRKKTEWKAEKIENKEAIQEGWKELQQEVVPKATNYFYAQYTKNFAKRAMEAHND